MAEHEGKDNLMDNSQDSTIEPEQIEKHLPDDKSDSSIKAEKLFDINKMDMLNEVYISLTIEIGRANIKIRDLLNLTKGSIIELDKLAGDPVNVYANGKLISSGNIITANGKYCVRLTSINDMTSEGKA
jgi:flagellar motor switch protein FliN/FliY